MRNFIFSVCFFLGFSSCFAQSNEVAIDPKAKVILDKASNNFSNKSGLSANLTITVNNNQNGKKSKFKGELLVKKEKFKLSLPDVNTYFDGKTEYVHLVKEKEVNISIPNTDELKETNPIFLLHAYKKGYKLKLEGAKKENGRTVDVVNLYPEDRNKPFSIITFAIDRETLLPVSVYSKGKNGIDTRVDITNCVEKNIKDTSFIFDVNNNKDVELIDLR